MLAVGPLPIRPADWAVRPLVFSEWATPKWLSHNRLQKSAQCAHSKRGKTHTTTHPPTPAHNPPLPLVNLCFPTLEWASGRVSGNSMRPMALRSAHCPPTRLSPPTPEWAGRRARAIARPPARRDAHFRPVAASSAQPYGLVGGPSRSPLARVRPDSALVTPLDGGRAATQDGQPGPDRGRGISTTTRPPTSGSGVGGGRIQGGRRARHGAQDGADRWAHGRGRAGRQPRQGPRGECGGSPSHPKPAAHSEWAAGPVVFARVGRTKCPRRNALRRAGPVGPLETGKDPHNHTTPNPGPPPAAPPR